MKTLLTTFLLALAATGLAADKPYPLGTCLVSGNKLGSMGKVIVKSYQGQEIKFCCKPCVKKFDANPAKYLSKLK
jgi:YHS domain-containing protein